MISLVVVGVDANRQNQISIQMKIVCDVWPG